VAGKTLIIGCGYIGLPLALELQARGHEIILPRRPRRSRRADLRASSRAMWPTLGSGSRWMLIADW
jgi:glycine/D-amino acid oxidase-like deaminating enzyme